MEPAEQIEQAHASERETDLTDVVLDSVALQRLIEEVRSDEPVVVSGQYNRTHNRHNR